MRFLHLIRQRTPALVSRRSFVGAGFRAADTMPHAALGHRCAMLHTQSHRRSERSGAVRRSNWAVAPRPAYAVEQRRHIGGLGRIAAQVAIVVGQAGFKIFMQAVAEAKAKGGNASAEDVARNVTGTNKMQVNEALEILNLESGATPDEIAERYDKTFAANDPAKGGSFYLQSKIYRAKESLDALHAPKKPKGGDE